MHRHTWLDRQRTDPSLSLQVPQGIGMDRTKDRALERAEKFLLEISLPLNFPVLLDALRRLTSHWE
jgi:hypothetical protein